MKRGFVLIEVTVAYVILAVAMVALIPVFILAVRGNKSAEQVQNAVQLSAELLEEMRLRKWDQSTPTPFQFSTLASATLGPEAGETDKNSFNDVDDFNGWREAGARDPLMNALPDFKRYTRTVTVRYVDASLAVSASTTDFKQATVCTSAPAIRPICLDTLFTNR